MTIVIDEFTLQRVVIAKGPPLSRHFRSDTTDGLFKIVYSISCALPTGMIESTGI